MRFLFNVLLLSVPSVLAQQAPYNQAPEAEAPYYRVRYEASTDAGALIFPVQYTVWIPQDVDTLRGVVVHQHGCGEGSCKSGMTGAYDLHWQALARKHRCALLAPVYEQPEGADCQMWCDPRNGSAATFLRGLADLGKISGHSELTDVPWALWGHSGGGHWVGGMTMLYPERVAAAWLRSGVPYLEANPERPSILVHTLPDAALQVPLMCNLGTKEGVTVKDGRFSRVWPDNEKFFRIVRARGGLVGVAVDPLSSHDCGNQRYLAIPWLDHCLSSRLTRGGRRELRLMSRQEAWLAPPLGRVAQSKGQYVGNPLEAAWLPNERFARLWESYVHNTLVPDGTPPSKPEQVHLKGKVLTWHANADIESGLAGFVILANGNEIARVPSRWENRFGRPVFQGLQYSDTPIAPLALMRFEDDRLSGLDISEIQVVAVNTAGLSSD